MPPCGYSCRLARETCRKDVVETSSGSRPPGASPDASPLCVQPSWRSLDTTLARWRRQRLHHPMLRLHVLGPVLFCTVLYCPDCVIDCTVLTRSGLLDGWIGAVHGFIEPPRQC